MFESQRARVLRMSQMLGEVAVFPSSMRAPGSLKSRLPEWLQLQFEYAGIHLPSDTATLIFLAIQILLGLFLIAEIGSAGVAVAFIPGLTFLAFLRRVSQQRAERFERDYAAFLLSLSSSIRTGLDPLVAFSRCGLLFSPDSVLGTEIKKSVGEIEGGTDEEKIFLGFARSVEHPDIGLLRTALVLSRRQGSSLGSCLHRLARVTRQRQSFRRKMRSAVAMQRLSAFGIAGCTATVGLIQFTSNPHALKQAWDHSLGRCALCGGLGLVLFGLIWMLHLSRRRL